MSIDAVAAEIADACKKHGAHKFKVQVRVTSKKGYIFTLGQQLSGYSQNSTSIAVFDDGDWWLVGMDLSTGKYWKLDKDNPDRPVVQGFTPEQVKRVVTSQLAHRR